MKDTALKIVNHAFKDKLDLAGKPYVEHLYRVSQKFTRPELSIIALLHDILEDCPEWNEQSLRCFFNETIVNTVLVLTRRAEEPYEEYIDRISNHSWAVQVKLADLEDNMNICRLKKLGESDINRLKKYHKAYMRLTEE